MGVENHPPNPTLAGIGSLQIPGRRPSVTASPITSHYLQPIALANSRCHNQFSGPLGSFAGWKQFRCLRCL